MNQKLIQRMKQVMNEKGITQAELSKRTGIRASSISDYLNNRYEPKQDKIYLIAEALSVNPGWLSGRDDSSAIPKTDPFTLKNIVPIERCMVPIIGQIAAGKPILADEHIEAFLPCDTGVHADFGLIVSGDSMIGADIHDGDVVFIRSQPIVDDGQIAAVRIDDDATLKRFYKNPDGDGCTLVSMNPKYPPMVFNSGNCDSIQIIGLAVAKYSVIKQ